MLIPKLLPVLAVLLPVAATAQTSRATPAASQGPQRLGSFGNWTAATYQEGGQKVCYAFTRAEGRAARTRQNVMLTVTHRPQCRDQVAPRAGLFLSARCRRSPVEVGDVGSDDLRFYSADNAFARDGSRRGRRLPRRARRCLKAPAPAGAARRPTPSP